MLVIDAGAERRPGTQGHDHRRRELEAQEVHRRGLLIVLPLEVLVGNGEHLRLTRHLHPAAVLDALQLRERPGPFCRFRKLDEQRDFPVAAIRDQRVVGGEFLRNAGGLEDALGASEKKDKDSQLRVADLGQRLNLALAQRVQELSRYRSDFFGKLREILGNRPDIRVVGDRFVFQSEVLFDTGSAAIRPEGKGELDKLASALADMYETGDESALDAYPSTALRRVWRAQDFSNYMTQLLHDLGQERFQQRLQLSRLDYLSRSEAYACSLAENYAGLPAAPDF